MGRYDPMVPGEIRPLNYRELNLCMILYALDANLQENGHVLKNRFAGIKRGKSHWGMFRWLARKIIEELVDTMDDNDRRKMMVLKSHGSLSVKAFTDIKKDQWDIVVSADDFNWLASYAIDANCATCMREGKEIKKCKLRQTMIHCVPPKETSMIGCEYQNIKYAMMNLDAKEKANG